MPLVTANPRGQQDGSIRTQFTDTTNTSLVTYTYPTTQSSLIIENSGERDIFVTVGTVTNQVIQVDKKWRYDGSFTSFSIRSDVNSQEFIATAIYQAVEDLASLTTKLAESLNQNHVNVLSTTVKNYVGKCISGKGNGNVSSFLTMIGDSYLEGTGATATANQYGSTVRDIIFANTNNGNPAAYEQTLKMDATGFTYAGTYAYGTVGAAKKSLILQPNATITFTRKCNYTDIWYRQTPTSGSIEIRLNGTLKKTINCSGTENLNVWTGLSNLNATPLDTDVWEIKCINAQVEITGITTVIGASDGKPVMYFTRVGVSGVASGYYSDTNTLTSLKLQGTYNNLNKGIFVLEIGTNDIYNSSVAVSANQYKTNITTILSDLKNNGHFPILVLPPKADPTGWTEVIEPYQNYINTGLQVTTDLNIPVVDLSKVDFVGLGLFSADKVHPNDNGHYLIAKYILDVLGVRVQDKPSTTTIKTNSVTVEVNSFILNTDNYNLAVSIPTNALITGVYIKNKTNGLVVPYQDYTDYANNFGLYVQKDFPSYGTKLYYMSAGGFCKTGRGPLGTLVTNTASDAQVIVEYITP